MPDVLRLLEGLGAASVDAVWLPVLAWTALVVLVDGALRVGRASARVGLGVRGALLALLPALLVAPPLLARWVPSFQAAAPLATPAASAPTTETVTAAAPVADLVVAAPRVSALDLGLGLAVVLAVVAAVLALGVLLGGLLWLARYRRTLGAAAASVEADARSLALELGVRGPLDVVIAEPTSAPFTVGWRRPVVAVPPDLGGERLELALAHEIAHVRDSHYGWGLAERVVRALFVWHPLVHALGRELALDRERAADAAVLRLWPERARRYGQLLHAVAARSSPALALGASSSPLLHRLDAMTRLRPDRPRLARLASLLVLVVPLLLAASAVPDAQTPPRPPAAPEAPEVGPFDEHIDVQRFRITNGDVRFEIELRPGTSRATAQAIADYYADGDEPGSLLVTGNDIRIERDGLRPDAYKPPPPPPAAPAPPSPPDAAAAPAPPAAPMPALPPAPPPSAAPPTPPAAPAPPAAPTPPVPPDLAALTRYVAVLEEELMAVSRELDALREREDRASSTFQAEYTRVDVRRDVILSQYRNAVMRLEEVRLALLRQEAANG